MKTATIPLTTAQLAGNMCGTTINTVQCKGRATWIALGASKARETGEYTGGVYFMWFCDEHAPDRRAWEEEGE